MMNERPNVTVVFQEGKTQGQMTCGEIVVSSVVLLLLFSAVSGVGILSLLKIIFR